MAEEKNSFWETGALCYEDNDVMMSKSAKVYNWTMIIFGIIVLIIGEFSLAVKVIYYPYFAKSGLNYHLFLRQL